MRVYKIGPTGRMQSLPADHKQAHLYHPTEAAARAAFEAKQTAVRAKYAGSKAEADRRLDDIETAFETFKAQHQCDIDYTLDGDTRGIYEDYMYISVRVNGFEYSRRIDQ